MMISRADFILQWSVYLNETHIITLHPIQHLIALDGIHLSARIGFAPIAIRQMQAIENVPNTLRIPHLLMGVSEDIADLLPPVACLDPVGLRPREDLKRLPRRFFPLLQRLAF